MGVFQFAMTGISVLTRFANGTFLINVRHMVRFSMVVILGIVAFSLIAFASYEGSEHEGDPAYQNFFYVAIFASVLVGMSTSMGEATFLGYCNGFPSHVVGYVSSGTGCAGITGTFTLLILQSLDLSNQAIFLLATPTMLIYLFSALWLNKQKQAFKFIPED